MQECQFEFKPTGRKARNCIAPKATWQRASDLKSHNIPYRLSLVLEGNEMTYSSTWGDVWARKHQCHCAIRCAGKLCFCSFFIFIHLLPLGCTKWDFIGSSELTHELHIKGWKLLSLKEEWSGLLPILLTWEAKGLQFANRNTYFSKAVYMFLSIFNQEIIDTQEEVMKNTILEKKLSQTFIYKK